MIIEITEYNKSRILYGESIKNLTKYIPDNKSKLIIISDLNIMKYHGDKFPKIPVIEIGIGEMVKTQPTISLIINRLIELGADRSSFLIGIGGGIVCDITGYVASVYMRGIDFGFVSTSLLSQVDASIGGKNGINFQGYKNIIGTFNHPEFVICDTTLLATLHVEEIKNGLAEIIKMALIGNPDMYNYLENNIKELSRFSNKIFSYLIYNSIKLKASIVNSDEKESGERKKLNLGHTFGHAIEKLTHIPHGQAVAVGIVISAHLSYKFGFCEKNLVTKITSLISTIGLPTKTDVEKKELLNAIRKDKKQNGELLDFVFIEKIGKVKVIPVSYEELNTYL